MKLEEVNEQLRKEIAERRRAEGQLREERNFISAILDTTSALVVVLDRDGRIIRFNRACERMTGYSFADLEGRYLWDCLLLSEEVARVKSVFASLQAGQFPNEAENYWITRDGGVRLVAWSNTAIVDDASSVKYVVGTGIDITDRRGAEEAVRASDQKYRELVESANNIILRMDSRGTITFFNEFAQKFFGYESDEIIGKNIVGTIVPGTDSSGCNLADRMADLGRHPERYSTNENENMRRNGERVWVAWTNTGILDDRGQVLEILCVGNDITERRLADEAVRKARDELSTLLELQKAITSRLDLDAVLQLIADEARRLTMAQLASVFLLEGDDLKISVISGEERSDLVGVRIPVRQSISGLAVLTGKPIRSNNIQDEPSANADIVKLAGIRSFLAVPLISGSAVIGMVAAADKLSGGFMPEDERVLTMLASSAVIGVENARLYHEEQQRRRENEQRRQVAESLRDILAVLNSNRSLAEILDYIVGQACRLLGTDAGAIFRLDAAARTLSIQASQGLDADYVDNVIIPVGQGAVGRAVARREAVTFTDLQEAVQDNPDLEDLGRLPYAERLFSRHRALLAVPLIVKDEVYGGIVLYYTQSRQFSTEEIALAAAFGDQAALAIENARLFERSLERARELAILNAVTATVSQSLDLEEILQDALDKIIQALGMEAGAAFRLDEKSRELVIVAERGLSPEFVSYVSRLPVGVGASGHAAREGKPVVRHVDDYYEPELRGMIAREGLLLTVSVPLLAKGRTLGAINASTRKPRVLTPEELSLLASIGQQVGIAVENARLYEQAEQSAAAAERSRLARDLHDAVMQTLFSASLLAEVLPRLWERSPEEGRRRLEELRQLTRGALAEMRTLLLELRPTALTESALGDLLRQLAEATTGRSRVPVSVIVEGHLLLPPEVQISLYRIAQEALNNVAKHASAGNAVLSLHCQEGRVELCVSDNGRGFDPASASPDNLGLGIMRERAEAIGAKLHVISGVGAGTRVEVVWKDERRTKDS